MEIEPSESEKQRKLPLPSMPNLQLGRRKRFPVIRYTPPTAAHRRHLRPCPSRPGSKNDTPQTCPPSSSSSPATPPLSDPARLPIRIRIPKKKDVSGEKGAEKSPDQVKWGGIVASEVGEAGKEEPKSNRDLVEKPSEQAAQGGNVSSEIGETGKEEPKSNCDRAGMFLRSRFPKGGEKGKKRVELWISLSKEEIEEDYFALTGSKLPRKPKKRSRAESYLEDIFPGSSLQCRVTPQMY